MKRPTLLLAVTATAVLAYAIQLSLPPVLTTHVTKLKEAQGLKAKVTVNLVSGAQTEYSVTFAKPASIKIDSPTRLVLSDGKTITVLDKAKNTYTQVPYDKPTLLTEAAAPEVLGWLAFFQEDTAKLFKTAKAAGTRKIRGVEVNVVDVTLPDEKTTASLYLHKEHNLVGGYQLTTPDQKQYIVWAETVELPATTDPTTFAFTAPAGATKIEPGQVASATWADVSRIFTQKCMPCHSSSVRSGTLDLSSYATASSNRFVIKSDSKNSILHLSLSASGPKRMPQGRPPLPESEKNTIAAWIDAGLPQ